MKVVFVDAPEGAEASFDVANGVLYIGLDPGLDEVARRRYITQAKEWAGIETERRLRGLLLPLPLTAGVARARHAAGKHKTGIAAVVAGVVAAGIAAAAVMPNTDTSNGRTLTQRPAVATPEVTPPAVPPKSVPRPRNSPVPPQTPPSQRPSKPGETHPAGPPAGAPHASPRPHPSKPENPGVGSGTTNSNPSTPKPPLPPPPPTGPMTRRIPPLLKLVLPPLGVRVRLSPQPKVRVHIRSPR